VLVVKWYGDNVDKNITPGGMEEKNRHSTNWIINPMDRKRIDTLPIG